MQGYYCFILINIMKGKFNNNVQRCCLAKLSTLNINIDCYEIYPFDPDLTYHPLGNDCS